MRVTLPCALLAVVLSTPHGVLAAPKKVPPPGTAEPAPAPAAVHDAAEEHLNVGKKHAAAGHCDQALPELEASIALRETAAAHIAKADCYKTTKKPALAWASYLTAAKLGDKTAEAMAKGLEPELLRVTLVLPKNVGEVRIDGNAAPTETRGEPLFFDASESHTIEVSTSDGKRWLHTVEGRKAGDSIRLTAFEEDNRKIQLATSDGSTQRTIGLVTGGIGILGLVAGSFFGFRTISARSDYDNTVASHCVNRACPVSERATINGLRSDHASAGLLSTVFFIGGGVLTAGGATLYLLAPTRDKVGAQIGGTF